MSARVKLGLWLLRPWLIEQLKAQNVTWKNAGETRDFQWGKWVAIRRLVDGDAPSTAVEVMERAEAMRAREYRPVGQFTPFEAREWHRMLIGPNSAPVAGSGEGAKP